MIIDPIPVGVGDPPPAPSAAPAGVGGPTFGQFLDNASANASGKAPAGAGQGAPTRAASPAGTAPSSTNPTSPTASNAPASTQSAAAPGQSSGDQPADKAKSSGLTTPFSGGGRGNGAADDGKPAAGDGAAQCGGGIVVPPPIVYAPLLPPTGGITPPTAAILTTAEKSAMPTLQSVAASAAAGNLPSSIASAVKDQLAPPAASLANAPASLASAATPGVASTVISPSALQGFTTTAAADLAAQTAAAAPLAPTLPLTTPTAVPGSSDAAPASGAPNNRTGQAPISAQAAALLGRLSVMGTTRTPTQPGSGSPVIGAAGTPMPGMTANSIIGATVATSASGTPAPGMIVPGMTATDGGQASPAATLSGGVAGQATPLPPVSGTVDLTPKFSAAAIPPHGAAAAPVAAKPKTDAHAATSASDASAGKPTGTMVPTAAEGTAAPGAAKPATAASLAGTPSAGPTLPGADDSLSGHPADPAAIAPQPRGDVGAIANGAPAISPAREASMTPIAALHSVADQVVIGLKRGVKSGNDQIQINLEPASLGKIAVRLDFAQDGRVSATFSADRADTLNLLNNDSRSLEQALRDAGLRADSGSLTFNLSSGDNGASARQFAQSASYAAHAASMDDGNPLPAPSAVSVVSTGLSHDGSLDIHV